MLKLMIPRRREPEYAPAVRRVVWTVALVLGLAASAPVLAAVLVLGDDRCPVPAHS